MLMRYIEKIRGYAKKFKNLFLSNTLFIWYSYKVQNKYIELKELLYKYTTNFDKNKLPLIKDLVNQEGEIDYEIEGYDSIKNQRPDSYKFRWGHNHNFGEIEVAGAMGDRHITMMAEFMVAFNLQKSFFLTECMVENILRLAFKRSLSEWLKGQVFEKT